MTQLNQMSITHLSGVEDSHLITYLGFAINRGVKAASAVGYIMKQGEPYRLVESRVVRVITGTFRISVDLIQYTLSSNESLYVGQNSIVEIVDYSPETTLDILGFTLATDDNNIRRVYKLGVESTEWMGSYFDLIYTTSKAHPFENRSVRHLLLSLHARIVDNPLLHNNEQSPPKGRKEVLFRSFIELLNGTSSKREVFFYAEQLNISSQYLSRLTIEVSGIAAGDWINRAVILRAKLLLRDKKLTVEQIAEELNISTLPYFCRLFKRETGLTPTEYRKMA